MSQQITIPGPGDLLADRYRIVEELGRGSYGVVFKAIEEATGSVVAIKTLLPQSVLDKEVIDRFEREAQLVSRLEHLHIIGLHDYGQRDNLFYMVMEFIEGRSLDELLKEDAPIVPDKAQDLMEQIMEALEHAHARGIVHRDLKPANILLRPDASGREIVKILDFGIAKALRDENQDMKTLTQAGHVLGTPHYMAPEQIAGDEIDHRADLYAMGVITYELLVGEHPFEGTSPTAVMVAHLRDDPPALPDHLERSKWGVLVREAMRKQPDDRIADAGQFLSLLRSNHDLIDADESNEVTALFTSSSLTEQDQGATQEMEPLTQLYHPAALTAGVARPASADATMQWQRKALPPQPDFGAQPLPPQASVAPSTPFPTLEQQPSQTARTVYPALADPAETTPGARTSSSSRSLLPVVVALIVMVCVVLATYAFWPASSPSDEPDLAAMNPDQGSVTITTVPDLGAPIESVDMSDDVEDLGEELDASPDLKEADAAKDLGGEKPKKQPPAMISVKITSEPRGARVKLQNREIGKTPLTHRIKQSDKTVSISVSKHGFTKKTRSIKPNKSHTLHFSLKPEMLKLSP